MNFTPQSLKPQGKNFGTHEEVAGSAARTSLDGFGEQKIPCPCQDSNPRMCNP